MRKKKNLADDTALEDEKILEDGDNPHTQTKAVINRMSRLIGHLNATKTMIEDGRDCSEILTQLSAVDAAIKAVSRLILKDHMEHCIIDAVQNNNKLAVKELSRAIEQFIK